jgi:hypothetical protein
MNNKIVLFFLICCCFFYQSLPAQVKERDSTVAIYQNIQELSKKSKFKKFVYKLFFRSSALKEAHLLPTKKTTATPLIIKKANGKIIRKIIIETLDPFGQSITDETRKPRSEFERFGNAIHLKTKEFTIRNLLLFKKNSVCDSVLLQESERLIRSQRYVRQVMVTPIFLETTSDSIDVKVRVLDTWSLIPNGSLSANQSSIKLTERNLLGLGHQISGNLDNRFSTNERSVFGRYTINNIKNTFIKLDLEYANEFNNDSKRSVNLARPFFSVFARNAGGIYFENRLVSEFFRVADTLVPAPVKFEFQEYWYGRAFRLSKKIAKDNLFTNLITAVSYNKRAFSRTPEPTLDQSAFFATENNIIGYVGISKQRFYQDRYIFNYDIIEDIPYGYNIALIFGHQDKNNLSRLYSGITISHGKKYEFGYLSSFIEWGSFYNKGLTEQTAFKVGFNYFSPLLNWGKWRFRQFIKPSYIWGNNRDASFKDQLTLNNNNGIQGFNNILLGSQKWIFSLQTQSYVPGSWYGFRFSPYLNISMGSLAEKRALFSSKVYSKLSVGIQINNDFLVFNNFQISFSYYPTIPFEGDNIFRTNSFENTDLSLNDFQLGKPTYIRYE